MTNHQTDATALAASLRNHERRNELVQAHACCLALVKAQAWEEVHRYALRLLARGHGMRAANALRLLGPECKRRGGPEASEVLGPWIRALQMWAPERWYQRLWEGINGLYSNPIEAAWSRDEDAPAQMNIDCVGGKIASVLLDGRVICTGCPALPEVPEREEDMRRQERIAVPIEE